MKDCIFCAIVAGEIPATKIYEDERVLAFMDIGPIVKGHTLVIPKCHSGSIMEMPPESLCEVMRVVQSVAGAQLRGLGADGVNIHQSNGTAAGQEVPHIHFHVIPRFADDGHSWNWLPKSYADSSEPSELAAKISLALETE